MLPPIDDRRLVERRAPKPASVPAVVNTVHIPEPERNTSGPEGIQSLTAYLWKQKHAIAIGAGLGLLAGLLVSLFTPPVYRARTSLQLESFNDQAFKGVTPVSPVPNASPEDYLQNEVKILESDTLARRVASKLPPPPPERHGPLHPIRMWIENQIDSLAVYRDRHELSPDEKIVQGVKNALTVRTALQSQVIELFFDAPNPSLAARGANIAASEFVDLNSEARSQLVQDTTDWLNKQAAELRAKLQGLNRQLQEFTAGSGLVVGSRDYTPAQERLRQVQDAFTKAEADRAAKQARYEAAMQAQGDVIADPQISGTLHQYQVDLQNLKRQQADLKAIYTDSDNRVLRVNAQIATIEAAIERERSNMLNRLKNEYLAAKSLENTLQATLNAQTTSVGQQTRKQLQYEVLKNDVDTTQKLYDSVLERAKDAGAASSLRVANVRVIDPASPPSMPYSPDLPLNMALGLGLGTLGSAGLVLLRTRSEKVKAPGEMESMAVRELGVVPTASTEVAIAPRDWSVAPKHDELNSFLLRESFRAVLTSILLGTRPDPGRNGRSHTRVLGVTSVAMAEGKTTIVSNLGLASAQMKRNVLLIDADLRRPRLHERFALPNRAGLTDLLQNPRMNWEPLIQPTSIPHLWVLPTGPVDGNSPGLLYSADLEEIIQNLSSRFELIFIDTPPLSMYPDARILGQNTDGVVMVVRANRNHRDDVRGAYHQLTQDRIHVLGTILNDWKIDRGHARAYTNYYHYYEHQNGTGD